MAFKGVSWNLLHGNKRVIRALNYIMGGGIGADFICLQEIPSDTHQLENSTEYDFFCAKDMKGRLGQSHLGILVRKGVAISSSHTVVEHNKNPKHSFIGKICAWESFQESHSILVEVDGRIVRIINCHLDVTGSILKRWENLDIVLQAHDDGNPIILCGDLNTFGCWWKNVFAGWWLFGIKLSELFVNEQECLDDFTRKNNLYRVFSKKLRYITHRFTIGWLDHILITKDVFEIKSKLVLPSIHKSDHRALSFVFEFKEPTK